MPDTLPATPSALAPEDVLGRVFLPKTGTPVGVFQFLVAPEALQVEIDTPVTAVTDEGDIIGVVTDMTTVGSMADPVMASYASAYNEEYTAEPNSSVRVATVQVYYAPALRPVSAGVVRSATREEILKATGVERIDVPVAAGVVTLAGGQFATASLDMHCLAGPEAAHLVIGGLSGQASKTSFAGVLLRSAMHSARLHGESMASIIFNVKGEDLVNLHLPPSAGYELTEDDVRMYEAMGVPPTPFEDVVVYSPAMPNGVGTRSSREDALPLQWGLKTIWRYLKYFSPGLYSNDNMSAFLGDFAAMKLYSSDPGERIDTFNEFEIWANRELNQAAENESSTIAFRNHHTATVRRALKLITSLPNRCGGLLTLESEQHGMDVPIDQLVNGQVIVVDIAGLEPLVQSAVIARTCERLMERAEKEGLDVEHLVLFADELNVFAPASGGEMEAVRKILTKISATGRYAGISLWGAAQFPSQVTAQVLGNAATKATGILADSEIDAGVFGRMPAGQRERVATLPKGTMALKAYNLRGMLTVKFPRPAWQTGRAKGQTKTGRKKTTDMLEMSPGGVAALTRGVEPERVEEIFAKHGPNVEAAVRQLEHENEPDMSKVSVEKTGTFTLDDAWSLE